MTATLWPTWPLTNAPGRGCCLPMGCPLPSLPHGAARERGQGQSKALHGNACTLTLLLQLQPLYRGPAPAAAASSLPCCYLVSPPHATAP